MTRNQAIRIALKCMEERKKHLAFSKNLQEKLHANLPSSESAYEEHKKIIEAENILERELNGQKD